MMDFTESSQIVPLALRRTHRANAGAKRKQAEEETTKAKDKSKEMKKKKKRHSAPPDVAATSPKSVTKMAADFIRSSKTKVPVPKAIKNLHPHNDYYCWVCHNQRRDGNFLYCNICPRVYHDTCAKLPCPQPDWVCWECEKVTDAECTETQSNAMASLTVDKLAKVLRTAIEKMKRYTNSLLFTPIDDLREFRDYRQFVYHPMDLSVMEKNVQDRCYGSTEAFLADAKWIVHNAFVYFGSGNRYSNAAKALLKACETEMNEVELCPDCYLGAVYKRAQWFSEVCTKPHPLVWAKLHGFPFWPAKAMKEEDGLIEARFFGQHDRAMIPVHNCFQYSLKIPFPASKKRLTGLNAAIKEVELHIKKREEKQGTPHKFALHLTPYDPNRRYTTSSLAVMPDGKVKSLTEAGRIAQMKGKVIENGKEQSKKEETKKMNQKEEGDEKMDSSVASSEDKEKADVKRDIFSEMKMDPSVASSVHNNTLDLKTSLSPNVYHRLDHVGMEHSYASKDFQMGSDECEERKDVLKDKDGNCQDSEENVVHSQEKEQEEEEHGHAGDKEREGEDEDEESASNRDRKRKLSESPTQQPPKMPRTSSGKDDTPLPVYEPEEPDGEDTENLHALSPGDTSNEGNSTMSQGSPSAESKTSINSADSKTAADIDKDRFSILPGRLPCLDDLEASMNSSESSSSIPEDDAKSNASTPRKDTFLLDLCKTIDTCKASLGIEKEEMEEEEEEVADEGGRDDEDGLEDADMTGDETMESEDDEDEGAEKEDKLVATASKEEDHHVDDRTKDGEHVGEDIVENKENGREDESTEVTKQVIEAGEDSADSPVIGDDQQAAMETEDDEKAKSQTLEKKECAEEEKKGEDEAVEDKMRDEGSAENGSDTSSQDGDESTTTEPSGLKTQNEQQSATLSKFNGTPMEASSAKDEEDHSAEDVNDDDDDEDDGGDDYDDDSSSDGALLIDEGGEEPGIPDKKGDGTSNKARAADTDTTKTGGDAKATPADTDNNKEEIPNDPQPEPKEKIVPDKSTGAEARKEEAKGKESSGKEAEKSSVVEDKKPTNLSETSKELLVGTPKAADKDPDYKKLINKVVDDAVKSFKELDESLTDASVDLKNLVLDLKREVISLKAKQELQEKELLHCNKLAAAEIRQVMEYSRDSKLSLVKRRYDKQKGDAIFATKGKQWCASCSQEANYFCCWNTSYCSYDCQERHWNKHEKRCQQKSGNFPFIPGPDFDPYRKKKKKKKRKREEEIAWLREYGIIGEEEKESDDEDPTWEPDPEDLPTMVPRKKTYLPSPGQVPHKHKPKVWDSSNSRPGSQHAPNRTWTQPSGRVTPRPGFKSTSLPSSTMLSEARQRFQTQLMNAAQSRMNPQTSSKQVYIPGTTVHQNRMPGVGQNVAGNSTLVINAPQRPMRFVQGPKLDMSKQPNVVYVGATQAGIQTGVPANLSMQTPVSGGSGGIQTQGASTMPIRLQVGPNNKIGVSSLVQALGQPLQQGGKYVIQLTQGQQGSNVQTVKVAQMGQPNQSGGNMPVILKNVIGGLPRGQGAVTPAGNVVQKIHPAGKKQIMVPRLVPGAQAPKRVVISIPISMPSVTNTAVSSISVSPAPVGVTNTHMVGNVVPSVTIPVAAVSESPSSTDQTGNAAVAQDS